MALSDQRFTFDESTGELLDTDGETVIESVEPPYSDDKIKSALLDHAQSIYSPDDPLPALIVLALMSAENIDRTNR